MILVATKRGVQGNTRYIHGMVYYWKGDSKTATSSPLLKKGGYVVRGMQWGEEAILVADYAVGE